MALVNNTTAPTANSSNDTFSLLSFANDASSTIKEAFNKSTKPRKVNIRKYIQKRVKRLNDAPVSSRNVRSGARDQQTKSKSASNKPSQRRPAATTQLTSHSQSLPVLNYQTPSTSVCNSFVQPSHSESNLYPQHAQPVEDPESSLDEILTFLGLESSTSSTPTMSRCSSDSILTTFIPPQSLLETQLPLAEHPLVDPFSPHSDCSDELFEDSAYCSPCSNSSGGRSYTCSPLPPAQAVSTGCEWTQSQSSPITTSQYQVTTTPACNWMAGYGPQATVTTAGYDYLPYHESPPCDQVVLSPTAIWDPMNYPEYF